MLFHPLYHSFFPYHIPFFPFNCALPYLLSVMLPFLPTNLSPTLVEKKFCPTLPHVSFLLAPFLPIISSHLSFGSLFLLVPCLYVLPLFLLPLLQRVVKTPSAALAVPACLALTGTPKKPSPRCSLESPMDARVTPCQHHVCGLELA